MISTVLLSGDLEHCRFCVNRDEYVYIEANALKAFHKATHLAGSGPGLVQYSTSGESSPLAKFRHSF